MATTNWPPWPQMFDNPVTGEYHPFKITSFADPTYGNTRRLLHARTYPPEHFQHYYRMLKDQKVTDVHALLKSHRARALDSLCAAVCENTIWTERPAPLYLLCLLNLPFDGKADFYRQGQNSFPIATGKRDKRRKKKKKKLDLSGTEITAFSFFNTCNRIDGLKVNMDRGNEGLMWKVVEFFIERLPFKNWVVLGRSLLRARMLYNSEQYGGKVPTFFGKVCLHLVTFIPLKDESMFWDGFVQIFFFLALEWNRASKLHHRWASMTGENPNLIGVEHNKEYKGYGEVGRITLYQERLPFYPDGSLRKLAIFVFLVDECVDLNTTVAATPNPRYNLRSGEKERLLTKVDMFTMLNFSQVGARRKCLLDDPERMTEVRADTFYNVLSNPVELCRKVMERESIDMCRVAAFRTSGMPHGQWLTLDFSAPEEEDFPTFPQKYKAALNFTGRSQLNRYLNSQTECVLEPEEIDIPPLQLLRFSAECALGKEIPRWLRRRSFMKRIRFYLKLLFHLHRTRFPVKLRTSHEALRYLSIVLAKRNEKKAQSHPEEKWTRPVSKKILRLFSAFRARSARSAEVFFSI